jgi:hypothetical protein
VEWRAEGVYAKRPFGGPEAVLAYLSRYTHRVAISNSRLLACDENGITFRWKDYRARGGRSQRLRHAQHGGVATGGKGADWIKSMALTADEFIRRFLIHVLPSGFHRIRHYGLLASGTRATTITRIRDLLGAQPPVPEENDQDQAAADKPLALTQPCPCCGGRMIVLETFGRTFTSRPRPGSAFKVDTS